MSWTVTFFDYTKRNTYKKAAGDCIVVSSAGHNLMIDTGDGSSVLDYAKNLGNLDLMLSHEHRDHWCYMQQILQRCHVGTLYLPYHDDIWARYSAVKKASQSKISSLVSMAKRRGTKVVYLKQGSSFRIGNVACKVIYRFPAAGAFHDSGQSRQNGFSLCTLFAAEGRTFLSCGDLEYTQETAAIKAGVLPVSVDVLKANHHGLYTSNKDNWLGALLPKYIAVTCAPGRKASERTATIARCRKYAPTYLIEQYGNIVFIMSKSGVLVGRSKRVNVTASLPEIKKGSKGTAVKIWQEILKSEGHSLTVDGSFGTHTDKCTKEFQKTHNLTVDGEVGENTWKKGLESVE